MLSLAMKNRLKFLDLDPDADDMQCKHLW